MVYLYMIKILKLKNIVIKLLLYLI